MSLAEFSPVLEATEQMLKSAKNAQWEALFSQEKTRDALIKKYFSVPVLDGQAVADAINQVLEKDKEIQSQVLAEQERLGQELKKLGHGKNAVKSYVNAS